MSNPERPGQTGIFGFTRGGPTVPTAPTSDPSEIGSIPEEGVRGATQEEARDANAGKYTPRGLTRFVLDTARRHPIITGGAAITTILTGFAVAEAAQVNISGIYRLINSVPSSDSKSADIDKSIFHNKSDKGTISTNNSITVSSLEDLKSIDTIPQSSEDGHTVNILMPLQGIPPSGKVDYTRDLTGKNPNNPIYAPESRQYALENGIRNEIFLKNIPSGSIILAPVDGEFTYDRIRNELPDGTIDGPTFFFKDENGILYQISIGASGKPLAPILDVPLRTMKDARDDYRKFLHPIRKGEPIATVLQQGEIDIFAQAWPSGQSGIEESSNGEPLRPINISFITDQQNLLIVLGK